MDYDNLLEVHIWTDTRPFSVMIYIRDQEQKKQVRYMEPQHKRHPITTEAICKWLILCGADFKILKPFHKIAGAEYVYQIIQERLRRFEQKITHGQNDIGK